MIEIILSILAPIWQYIAGGVALLFGAWLWKRKNARIEQQDRAITTYKAKEEIHRQDQVLESDADKQINELREKVDNESPQKGAEDIAGAINRYFGDKSK